MSAQLLERLKIKPVPTKIESIEVSIPVINRVDQKVVDRENIIRKVKEKLQVVKKGPPPSEPVLPITIKVKRVPKKIKKLKLVDKTPEEEVKILTVRRTKRPKMGILKEGSISMVKIGDELIKNRFSSPSKHVFIRASTYYMNDREKFISFINNLFEPYREELRSSKSQINCEEKEDEDFALLTHQKIVRDYINVYTPYRGLLLYHGLGSGKTCSSIAIAEGIKNQKKIIVMTPAALRMNYIEELKKCGDSIYRKNQFWEFIDIIKNPSALPVLSQALSLSGDFIKRNGGAWLVNVKKPSNFEDLSADNKTNLDKQLIEMIHNKYKFINYNGLRNSHLRELTINGTINPFDNAVVIIDEAHNFVSRIVNKLLYPDSLSMKLYEYLMRAEGARIVFLTGTPVINYPNEFGILFNILRGYIKTWSFPLNIKTNRKINQSELKKLFHKFNILDYLEYKPSSKTLVVTRNPFGFVDKFNKSNDYIGVQETGAVTDDEGFEKIIVSILRNNDIDVVGSGVRIENYKALPDELSSFKAYFIDKSNDDVKNINLFQRRILGLTSYFRSAQEKLMPQFSKEKDFHIINIDMSDYQFGVYEEARIQERKLESRAAQKSKKVGGDIYVETVSTYRVFSRAFCNFVFPRAIQRPMPHEDEDIGTAIEKSADEDILDATDVQEKLENPDGRFGADDIDSLKEKKELEADENYEARIKTAVKLLKERGDKYLNPTALETYSPKFLNILENIKDDEHRGLHLVYSQFRTLEGIGILKLILEYNGFAQFRIKKNDSGNWTINIPESQRGKPTFALYTGTESPEEKEIIRNIFNSTWKYVPNTLVDELKLISRNNIYGEIIKVLMITSSGAEGISLKNVRYVHITEPYWHPVRIEQVIGRARRICSHQDLPEDLRTVSVFLYLMNFSEKQLEDDASIELRLKDKSKFDKSTPITSDQALYEISTIKEEINKQLLTAVKQASMDCILHSRSGSQEKLKCFSFGSVLSDKFSYQPSIATEESDVISDINKFRVTWKAKPITIQGKIYALNEETNDLYDFESYKIAIETGSNPILLGKITMKGKKYIVKWI